MAGRSQRFRINEDDRTIFRIAIPALGALAADPLVSIVDTAFVGRIGGGALASLGVATGVFTFAFFVFNALAYASTPLISRALGRGDRQAAGEYAAQALVLAAIIGVVGLVVLELAAPFFVQAMGATSEIDAAAISYLRIRGLALPAVLAITVGHGVFRGVGDTKTPLYVSLGFNLVNLALDPLLIFGFDWGLNGAAIASLVAQLVGGSVFLWLMLSGRTGIAIPRRVKNLSAMRSLLGAGTALTVRTFSLVTTFTVATSVATRLGVNDVAGHQVASQIWIFLALVVDSIAIAGQTLVAGHIGEGQPKVARRLANRMLSWGFVWGVLLAITFWMLRVFLPGWFTNDPAVVAVATSVATRLGVNDVAGHQVASQIWIFLALVVDSIAIAGQTLVAGHIGEGQPKVARRLANRMLGWGLVWGVLLAIAFWMLRGVLPGWFTNDPTVVAVATVLLPFVALTQPLNGVVFVFDGIFIGAGEFRFLGLAMTGAAIVTCLLLLAAGSITAVWWALTFFMVARIVPMAIRYASAVS